MIRDAIFFQQVKVHDIQKMSDNQLFHAVLFCQIPLNLDNPTQFAHISAKITYILNFHTWYKNSIYRQEKKFEPRQKLCKLKKIVSAISL